MWPESVHMAGERQADACRGDRSLEVPVPFRKPRRRSLRPLVLSALSTTSMVDFLEHWRASRSRRHLVGALPWMGVSLCAGLLVTSVVLRETQHIEHHYEQLLEQAQRADNLTLQTRCLESLAGLSPGNAQRWMELGVFLVKQGDRDRGLTLIQRAADGSGTGLADAHVWLAKDLLNQSEQSEQSRAETERHLQAALVLSPAAPETHVLLADFYDGVGESYLAERSRFSAARLDPRLYPAALSRVRRNSVEEIRDQVLWKEAISTLENRLAVTPANAQLRAALAEVLVLNQRLTEAGQVLNEPVESDDSTVIDRALSRWNVAQALALMDASPLNHDACLPLLKAALRLDPGNAEAIRLAENLDQIGMNWPPETFSPAIRTLSETLETSPDSDSVRVSLSQLLGLADRYPEAVECLAPLQHTTAALRLLQTRLLVQSGDLPSATRSGESLLSLLEGAPPSTSNILLTAECLLLLERPEEALQMLRKHGLRYAPTAIPESLATLCARACLATASARLQSGETPADKVSTPSTDSVEGADMEQADQPVFLLFLALACDSTRYQALDHLTALTLKSGVNAGEAQAVVQSLLASGKFAHEILSLTGINAIRQGQYDRAVTVLRQALACEDRADPRVLNNLALAMVRNDAQAGEEALSLINQALAMLPDNPDLLSTRGEIHVARQQWNLALADLSTSLEHRPDSVLIHRLLDRTCTGLNADRQALKHRQMADRLEGLTNEEQLSAH